MGYEQLKLGNQLCFPVYAASRLITRQYKPHLEKLGITYPQYLVLMILWETDKMSVNEIGQKLLLNTNTLTPLLKRMETLGLLQRRRATDDERKVIVSLTGKGEKLRHEAAEIPEQLVKGLTSENISLGELIVLKEQLYKIIQYLSKEQTDNQGI